jgi:hypothetical protein
MTEICPRCGSPMKRDPNFNHLIIGELKNGQMNDPNEKIYDYFVCTSSSCHYELRKIIEK